MRHNTHNPFLLSLWNLSILTVIALLFDGVRGDISIRAKRESKGHSVLTIEWEGIHTNIDDESQVAGFTVEYRQEFDSRWIQHDGLIPYKGQNFQYRVRIKDLPSATVYLVRINVLSKSNTLLYRTPEVKAESETVRIVCEGKLTHPKNVQSMVGGSNSLQMTWEVPECGSVAQYEYQLTGEDLYATFEHHTASTGQRSINVRNLLPGTRYVLRVRAIDSQGRKGPWSSARVETRTDGTPPGVSKEIETVYRSDSEIRVSWVPFTRGRVNHYEVMIVEKSNDGAGIQLYRVQVDPHINSYVFRNLKPGHEYVIGVIAYVNNEPTQVYNVDVATTSTSAQIWSSQPTINTRGVGKFVVQWGDPVDYANRDIKGFLIEYRMPNESEWRESGKMVPYRQGQSDYQYEIDGLSEKIFYVIRVSLIDEKGELVATTDEQRFGKSADTSCAGDGGVPLQVEAYYIGPTSIHYRWQRPECDESYGPIDGYEYLFWNIDRNAGVQDRPTFTGDTRVTMDGLKPSHNYAFRIRARSRGGPSTYSSVLKATTLPLSDARQPRSKFNEVGRGRFRYQARPADQTSFKIAATRGRQDGRRYDGNIYQLRIVLSPPKTYLAWTPLPEHQGRIERARVSYKESASDQEWVRIDDTINRFKCPQHVAPAGDYCYDLTNLKHGVQYTCDLIYRLDNGEWSRPGNPLFFILVEAEFPNANAGDPPVPSIPTRLDVRILSDTRCSLSWLPPLSEVQVDDYKITVLVLRSNNPAARTGAVFSVKRPGNIFQETLTDLHPGTVYNMSVSAGSNSFYGPAAYEIVNMPEVQGTPEIGRPQVEQRGSVTTVRWFVKNGVKNVYGYIIDVRDEKTSQWVPHGSMILQTGDERSYTANLQDLTGNTRYYVRIRAIDRGQRTLATSDSTSLTTQCEAPRAAPNDFTVTSADSKTILLRWTPPERQSWGCAQIYYNVEGTANGKVQRFRIEGEARGGPIAHRIPSQTGTEWRLKVQTANSGGVSPFTRERIVRTEQEALVSQPRLTPRGGDLHAEWRSMGQGQSSVYGYRVEYRSTRNQGFQVANNLVPYGGDGLPYTATINDLNIGETYIVRVQVLDRSQRVIFTSPEATTQMTCDPPTEPPYNLQMVAPDPKHVRISWQPPAEDTWNCKNIEYELQPLEPPGAQIVRINARQTTHVFNSAPNQRWSVQIRTKNSAGTSKWSRAVAALTPPPGELIVGPTVSYAHDIPSLSWRSIPGVADLVAGYRVEYSPEGRSNFQDHSSGYIRYNGHTRPYVVAMPDLPEGQLLQVRVKVLDANNGIAYTSPAVPVQTRVPCRAPTSPPSDVKVQPIGTDRVRVMWRPLSQPQWNCDRVWYLLKYSSPTAQGFKNFTAVESSTMFSSLPFTNWEFQIQAVNPAGASPMSRVFNGKTAEAIPGQIRGLNIIPVGSDSLRLNWQQPANPNGVITAYQISYQLINRGMCREQVERDIVVTSNTPTYSLTGLQPHSLYKVSVQARTTSTGPPVTQQTPTGSGIPTAAPTNIQPQNIGSTSATLVWQAPPCESTNGEITEYEYEIVGQDPWAVGQRRQSLTPSQRATVDALTPFTRYQIRVRAYTSLGAGPWSSPQPMTTDSGSKPLAPPMLRVIDTEPNSVQLMWQSPFPPHGEIDSYKVQSSPGGRGVWETREFRKNEVRCDQSVEHSQRVQLPQGATLNCATITGLRPEQLYDFQVSAHLYGKNWGDWSNTESARTSGGPVPVLSVDRIGGSANSLEIRYGVRSSDIPRVKSFRIMIHPTSSPGSMQQYTVDGNTYTYRLDSLRPNTMYNVTVQARTETGFHQSKSAMMNTDEDRVPAVLNAPRVMGETENSVSLQWDTPANDRAIESYVIEYRTPPNGAWSKSPNKVPHQSGRRTHTGTLSALSPNSDVEVRIRTMGRGNKEGPPSPTATARTKCAAPTSPPQGVRLDAPSPQEVRISWARPARGSWSCDQLGVELWHSSNGRPQTVMVGTDQTEYVLPSAPHTNWVIKLRATNAMGQSPWSDEYRITTKQGAPGPIRNLGLRGLSPNEVLVTWSEPIDKQGVIVGYDISYRLKNRLSCINEEPRDVSRDWITVYNVKDLTYTLTGLLPFSDYEVKVRARTTELGPEETKSVSTKPTPPSAPPLDLKATYILERSISFVWDPIECSQRHGQITNYEYELIGQDDWAKLERRVANTTQGKIDIDGLTPYTKYIMRVKGYNNVGGGPNTENLEIQTAKAGAPLPPQDLVVMQEGPHFFVISWLPPYPPYGPLDSYRIRYREFGNQGDWLDLQFPSDDPRIKCQASKFGPRLCFNITGLDSGKQFRVQTGARIEGGSFGAWSEEAVANTLELLPDSPRTITLIEKTDHSIRIGWEPPSDPQRRITEYKITWEPVGRPGSPKSATVDAPTTEYQINKLDPDTNYNITVQAGTQRGLGPGIWTRYSTDSFEVPSVGTQPRVTPIGSDQLSVEWDGVSDSLGRVQGYIIELKRSGETPQEYGNVIKHDNLKRKYLETIRGLEADTDYYVTIKVIDKKGSLSNPSPEGKARTGCAPPQSPPINIGATAPRARQVVIRWQPPPQPTWRCSSIKYRLRFRNGTLGQMNDQELSQSSTDYTFTSVPHQSWSIQLRTENQAGESDWSDEINIRTPEAAPGQVENVDARPDGPEQAVVTWDAPRDPNGEIKGYIVTYQLKNQGQCANRPGPVEQQQVLSNKMNIRDLKPASTYEVTVRARTTEDGPASSPVEVTTEDSAPTGPPQNVRAATVSTNNALLGWEQPSCESSNGLITGYDYELEALDSWVRDKSQRGNARAERAELNNLVPFTKYRFRVKATNSKGDGPLSDWVEFTTKSGAPPQVMDVKSEGSYPHAIAISFKDPTPPHGLIDDYRIRWSPSGRSTWTEVRVSPSELACATGEREKKCYRIGDLESEMDYGVQVMAHTRDGDWGEWSDVLYVKTTEAEIPVHENELRIEDRDSESISVGWQGFDPLKLKNLVGYALEYSGGRKQGWKPHGNVIRSRDGSIQTYRQTVDGLQPDTDYFFRLKLVHKSGKQGLSGPEKRARTTCGAPSEPPKNIELLNPDFDTLNVKFDAPDKSTWKCGDVVYVLKFRNSTNNGYVDIDPRRGNEHTFKTAPGTRWSVEMRTQAVDNAIQKRGEASPWSPQKTIVTQGLPGEVFVDLQDRGPNDVQVTWDLPEESKNWDYGVDISYRLKQKGDCPEERRPTPVTLYNIQDRQTFLRNLEPYSLYEVEVTPRTPAHLEESGIKAPSGVEEIRTGELEPNGAPEEVKLKDTTEFTLAFKWEPPACEKRRGEITQYEYTLTGIDQWVQNEKQSSVTTRKQISLSDLHPGTRYRFQVRAYTKAGYGPYSAPIEARTAGSELGAPRELHTIDNEARRVSLHWFPPYPLRGKVVAYRLRHGTDDGSPREVTIRPSELDCSKQRSPIITSESLCYILDGLEPTTTYRIDVQAQGESGNWGDWSPEHYVTTKAGGPPVGGSLNLLSSSASHLKVRWQPPSAVQNAVDQYRVSIVQAHDQQNKPIQVFNVSQGITEYHFKNLEPNTPYNITVEGVDNNRILWYHSRIFSTTEKPGGLIPWLDAPTNLRLLEKTDTMLMVAWDPPEILLPQYEELVTHYKVTIARFDPDTRTTGPASTYTVNKPGNKIRFPALQPETIYNITVQAGTANGYGGILWGVYSTLAPPGRPHVLHLRTRTPTSLHVYWKNEPWGLDSRGYILKAQPLYSNDPKANLDVLHTKEVDPGLQEYIIKGLNPSTVYNVSLIPRGVNGEAWGAYATLPPGAFAVTELRVCSQTLQSTSLSWKPIEDHSATHYQVRYARPNDPNWTTMLEKSKTELRCPGDPCNKLCYLLFNLDASENLIIQVRAYVEGNWNRWKSAVRSAVEVGVFEQRACCIVAPNYFVESIGDPATMMTVQIRPVPNDTYVLRYHVVVDERDPAGPINETLLTDKVTAKRNNIPYYIAASFDKNTLTEEREFPIGDGKVYGGYLNYPLIPGKKYNWAFVTHWQVDGKPIYGFLREGVTLAGWPWWWLLLLLLLLLLLILLCCCLFWCLTGRYRKRKETRHVLVNGSQTQALLGKDEEKGEMASNLKQLESRIDNIRTQLESRAGGSYESRDGDRETETDSEYGSKRRKRRALNDEGKGDFEDGYVRGFRDSNKVGSASASRANMEGQYGATRADFHSGYVQGLRDAGQNISTSMHNLARRPAEGGFSSGYMQGFRDGNSGIFGDRITTTLLRRLEEQYPNQEDYRAGYIEGFRDSTGKTGKETANKDLSHISERLSTLERSKTQESAGGQGDEIHTTKIYHVYNQMPDGTYTSQGQQLAQELDQEMISSSSRRSTLRRHYTPGDYMRYTSDNEGYSGSLPRYRRTLSANALARDESPPPFSTSSRHASGGAGAFQSSLSRGSINQYGADTYSRRYGYRSKSDMGRGSSPPRRYPSQTILDGARPGPTTPSWRRDALETLQKELDTISRQPRGSTTGGLSTGGISRGYSSDTGYVNDTMRSGTSYKRDAHDYGTDATNAWSNARSTLSPRGSVASAYTSRSWHRGAGPPVPATPQYELTPLIHSPRVVEPASSMNYESSSRMTQYTNRYHESSRSGASSLDSNYESHSKSTKTEKTTTSGVGSNMNTAKLMRYPPPNVPASSSSIMRAGPAKETVIPISSKLTASSGASNQTAASSSLAQAYNLVGMNKSNQASTSSQLGTAFRGAIPDSSGGSGDEAVNVRGREDHPDWTDELMRIVREPMDDTLDRMKKYSNSMTQLAPGSPHPDSRGGDVKESVQQSYNQSYKEEYTVGR